jgi:hypothetical protein
MMATMDLLMLRYPPVMIPRGHADRHGPEGPERHGHPVVLHGKGGGVLFHQTHLGGRPDGEAEADADVCGSVLRRIEPNCMPKVASSACTATGKLVRSMVPGSRHESRLTKSRRALPAVRTICWRSLE